MPQPTLDERFREGAPTRSAQDVHAWLNAEEEPNSTTREALEAELAQMRDRLETVPKEERRLMEGYRKGLYPDYMMREEMDPRQQRTGGGRAEQPGARDTARTAGQGLEP